MPDFETVRIRAPYDAQAVYRGETRHFWLCHVAVPRARSVGASGIVRPPRQPSATWSSPQREARGAFGLR